MNVRLNLSVVFVLCIISVVYCKNVEKIRTKRTIAGFENNCENVKPFFQLKNISLSFNSKGAICGGQCCDDKAETILQKQGQKDFASLLRHNSRSLQGLLNFTAATLQSHVLELSRQSENKTLLLFSQVYKGMAVLSKGPINALYTDIRNYIQMTNNNSTIRNEMSTTETTTSSSTTTAKTTTTVIASNKNIDIKASVNQFFADFFPLVYHHILLHNTANKDFTFDYKSCLKKTIDTILPFGEIPKEISQSLSKSLEATKLLLQAFQIGKEVLNTTEYLLIDDNNSNKNIECHNALLKMTYCPKCLGLTKHTKPCSGYCLNVLRGCLTKYVAELDSPWNGYVEGIESLVNAMKKNNLDSDVNADFVIRSLDTRISEAIMRAMEKGQDIDNRIYMKMAKSTVEMSTRWGVEFTTTAHINVTGNPKLAEVYNSNKVKRNCGPATFSDKEDPLINDSSTPLPIIQTNGKPRSTNQRVFAPLLESSLLHFLTSIAKTRGFYGNLADTLCQDESFTEPKDQRCWNGERIAEYTKTVVDVGLDMQKYNPEVKPTTNLQNIDPRVADLVDKLRHVHHMAMSSVGSSITDADYMQRDGVDGSGSGSGPDFDDGSDDEYNTRGSGSGHGPTGGDSDDPLRNYDDPHIKPSNIDPSYEKPPSVQISGTAATIPSTVLISLVLFIPSLLIITTRLY